MKCKVFLPTVLAIAFGTTMMVGCSGGGGGAATTPGVSTPPVGTGDTGTGGTTPTPPNSPPSLKVRVGVIDTGANAQGSVLAGNVEKVIRYQEDFGTGKITVTDLTSAPADVQDIGSTQHGSIVSAIIAGNAVNGSKQGVANGIADIYAAQTFDQNGSGFVQTAFRAMVELQNIYDVNLFNGSFGSAEGTDLTSDPLIISYAKEVVDEGGLIILSAGNSAKANSSPESLMPITDASLEKGWLAVAGLNPEHTALFKTRDGTAGSNACGDAARWCLSADFVNSPYYVDKTDELVTFYGTSGAAPQVTGTAALVWSKYPWMTPDQVRQTILTSAQFMEDGSGAVLFNNTFGWGYLDTAAALKGPEMFSTIFGANFNANVTSDDMFVFSNNISGDAGLVKDGIGTLVLSGDNTYTGDTQIIDGKLVVTGANASNFTNGVSGELTGKGSVNNLINNGTINTKDGALTVKGDFTQSATGVLTYTLNKPLTVDGAANLDGSLEVFAEDDTFVTEGNHVVLTSGKGVNGEFAAYSTVSPFLKVNGVTYASDAVTADVAFGDAALAGTTTGGISTVAGSLTNQLMDKANQEYLATGQSSALTSYVAGLQQVTSNQAAQAVLDSNSGAMFAENPSVLLRNDALVNAQIARRSHELTKNGTTGVWATSSFIENQNGANGWDKVNSDIYATTVGVDANVNKNLVAGAYITDYSEKSDYSTSNGKNEVNMLSAGVYGKWKADNALYVSGNAHFGKGDNEFNRSVFDGVTTTQSNVKGDVEKAGVYAEAGLDLAANQFTVSPFIGLSHDRVKQDAIKETNAAGVAVSDLTAKETKAHAGVRFDYKATPNLSVGGFGEYAYAFDRSLPTVGLSSNLDSSIVVNYAAPEFDKDFFLYGVGFNYLTPNKGWNIFGDVAGVADKSKNYQVQLGLKYAF